MLEDLLKENLDSFLNELPTEITSIIDAEELQRTVKIKMIKFLKRNYKSFNNLTTLQLYRDLEFLKRFKKGEIVCDNEEKSIKMILEIYNTCIIPKFKKTVEMDRKNYHNVINDIISIINIDFVDNYVDSPDRELITKLVNLSNSIETSDKLTSLKIVQFTKYLVCLIRNCIPRPDLEPDSDFF